MTSYESYCNKMETKKIIVLQGLPASGKSTWAKAWANEDSKNRVRFNRDDVRNMLGAYWVPSRESLINEMYLAFLHSSMVEGFDIVIDNMNLNKAAVAEIEEEVKAFNKWISLSKSDVRYKVEYKSFLEVPLETCIERDSKRDNPIGEKTIRQLFDRYKHLYPELK